MNCKHFDYKLSEKDRYWINSEEDSFCVLCLVNRKGPLSQEEVRPIYAAFQK